jgi:hypothetical protein
MQVGCRLVGVHWLGPGVGCSKVLEQILPKICTGLPLSFLQTQENKRGCKATVVDDEMEGAGERETYACPRWSKMRKRDGGGIGSHATMPFHGRHSCMPI